MIQDHDPGDAEPAERLRAGDIVRPRRGPYQDEEWLVAVYDAETETAHIAGWPYTAIAARDVELVTAATDDGHARMIAEVGGMPASWMDPRAQALARIQARGGRP